MPHPFQRASAPVLILLCLATLAASVWLMSIQVSIGQALTVSAVPGGILSFEFSGFTGMADAIVTAWRDAGVVADARRALLWDLPLLIVYPLFFASACALFERLNCPRGKTTFAGAACAWGATLAGGFDLMENGGLWLVLQGGANRYVAAAASAFAGAKFLLLLVAGVYIVASLGLWTWELGPVRCLWSRFIDSARGTLPGCPQPTKTSPTTHALPEDRSERVGICFSGGGIRSAAYNLGVLQVLREHGIFDQASHLAAVSGGSYIAASAAMVSAFTDDALLDEQREFDAGSPEEEHLRNRTSYMAPGIAGAVRAVSRLVLGMTLNVILVGAMILLLARPLGWIAAATRPELLEAKVGRPQAWDVSMWREVAIGLAAVAAGSSLLMVGRRWSEAAQRYLIRAFKVSAGAAGAILFGLVVMPMLIDLLREGITALWGWLADIANGGEAAKVGASESQETDRLGILMKVIALSGLPALLFGAIRHYVSDRASKAALAIAWVAAPLLIFAVTLGFANDAALHGLFDSSNQLRREEMAWMIGAGGILLILYLFSDLTAWSLHPFYKRRLSTAFAIKRVDDRAHRRAEELEYDDKISLSVAQPKPVGEWPELIVCAVANVSDEGATPPGRNATPFTFTATEVGGPLVGYVRREDMEAALRRTGRLEDLTLPAAVAMSGAAFSPSMGKMTKPSMRFLLALTNARLGVWLPNPRGVPQCEQDGGVTRGWRWRPKFPWLIREMRGLNRLNARFLYVTDGGHYDNLGLVELLRRGCTRIYCFDAAGDQIDTFHTLGEAVALARTDLGVEIDIDPEQMEPDPAQPGYVKTDHVCGTFTYRGKRCTKYPIVFAKAGVTESAPWDVKAYREKDEKFPTHSTFQQLYTDEKFEAYRALGRHTAERVVVSSERLSEGARSRQPWWRRL